MTEPDGQGEAAAERIPRRPTPPKRRRLRTFLKITAISFVVFVVLLAGAGVVLYHMVDVPKPDSISTSQAAIITYADGKTTLAKVGTQNRTDVSIGQIPERVRNAVLAAEDRKFYSEGGVSITGIVRAAWNNVRGGSLQGGSTITQQYVKNAFLTQQRTLTRKVKEAIIATKLSRKYSKAQILEWYLNTIYFGRGAYGIQAAAQTYFGKPVGALSTAEAAVLASSIRSPALYDPQNHPAAARARWHFVIDGLVAMGKLDQAAADALRYPAVKPVNASNVSQLGGPDGHIVDQVKEELAQHGFDEATLGKGIRVVTTIDKRAQTDAVNAVKSTFAGQPKNLRNALVAIDPRNGQVRAYYGGSNGFGFDYAQSWRQPGSTFKPYVLAAALSQTEAGKQDITDATEYNGTSPQVLGGVTVHNSDGESCSYCSVVTAMTMSLNTVFYQMGLQVGPDQVAKTAHAAGIPETNGDTPTLQGSDGRTDAGIAIGQYEVRPIDQAAGYSTIADGGIRRQPYFVKEVLDSTGRVLYRHKDSTSASTGDSTRRAFSSAVANDVTYSLEQVAASSGDPLANGRPSASKTGTAQLGDTADNKDAWMVGFTPKICTSVWTGSDGSQPIKNAEGSIVYGSGLPGQTWQKFMDAYLGSSPPDPLPTHTEIGPGQQSDSTPTPGDTAPSSPTPERPSSSAPSGSASATRPSNTAPTSTAPTSARPSGHPPSSQPHQPVPPSHHSPPPGRPTVKPPTHSSAPPPSHPAAPTTRPADVPPADVPPADAPAG